MPTVFAHGVFAWASVNVILRNRMGKSAAFAAISLAILPDADVIAFKLGIGYGEPLGHRGLSHSIAFALCTAAIATWLLLRTWRQSIRPRGISLFFALFIAAISHPLLDMLTNGGHGVALFAPLSWDRVFFSIRPIPVSPIGIRLSLIEVILWECAFFLPVAAGAWLLGGPNPNSRRKVGAMVLFLIPFLVGYYRVS
jgi:inner membrane protein